jgi:hypothetical protein
MPTRWRWPPESWCGGDQLLDPSRGLGAPHTVQRERVGQDLRRAHARRQRGVRILEHDLCAVPEPTRLTIGNAHALEQDLAVSGRVEEEQ